MGAKNVAQSFHRSSLRAAVDFVFREPKLIHYGLALLSLLHALLTDVAVNKRVVDQVVVVLAQIAMNSIAILFPVSVFLRLGVANNYDL